MKPMVSNYEPLMKLLVSLTMQLLKLLVSTAGNYLKRLLRSSFCLIPPISFQFFVKKPYLYGDIDNKDVSKRLPVIFQVRIMRNMYRH